MLFINSHLQAKLQCETGYTFPNGQVQINLACINGEWENMESGNMPLECLPYCPKGCHNGGSCALPGICKCQLGFEGDECQVYVGTPCKTLPPALPHSSFTTRFVF